MAWLVALCASCPLVAHAHDPGLSQAHLEVHATQITAVVAFSERELGPTPPNPGEVLRLVLDGRALEPVSARVESGESEALRYHLRFSAPAGQSLEIQAPLLARLAFGHRQYVTVVREGGDDVLAEAILSARADRLTTSLTGERGPPHGFPAFLLLGVQHLLEGYDHLLFVLALLLATRTFHDVLRTVTAFTVAHSLTLAVAMLGVIRLPPEVAEPMIAASIVWVGLTNLLAREPEARIRPAFLFGLVHGFGFASVLSDLGVGTTTSLVLPLLAFNLGVEAGQLLFASLLLPLLWWARSRPWIYAPAARAASTAVVLAGAFWCVERLLA